MEKKPIKPIKPIEPDEATKNKPVNQEKRTNIILYSLAGLLIIAIALFILSPNLYQGKDFTYKNKEGEKFEFVTGYVGKVPIYTAKVSVSYGNKLFKNYEIPLRNKPKDLESILIHPEVKQKILNSRGIFISMDPELDQKASIAAIQLAKVIGTADYGVFKIPTQGAFTQPINITNNQDYPVKTCDDATPDIRVIMITLGGENTAYVTANCVIIKGTDGDNLIKVAEAVVLNLLNVL